MKRPVFLLLISILMYGFSPTSFTRDAFYTAFQGNSYTDLNNLLDVAEKTKQDPAYIGAMYLKLAGLEKSVQSKLRSFKKGKTLLDSAILKKPKKTEWRFLRFAIQENVPKFLKYDHNLEEDKKLIISGFSSCDKKLQTIILNYTKSSTILKASELK